MSIVVNPAVQGKEVASQLFETLKTHFQSLKIKRFKVVVGTSLLPAGRPATEITIHQGETSRVYTWDLP